MFKFNSGKSILNPSEFCKEGKDFPKTVLATWQKGIVDCAFGREAKSLLKPISSFTCGTTSPIYLKDSIGICLIPSGGPAVAMFIEEIKAHGAQNFVFIGNCGVLDEKYKNNLIIPNKALRDEGTSWHYTDSKDEFIKVSTADTTQARVEDFLNTSTTPIEVVQSTVWTTDCPFRETQENVNKALSKGCTVVDMECASIMAVSEYLGVGSYEILYPADTLYNKEWKEGFLKNIKTSIYNLYFEMAFDLATKINFGSVK